VTRSRQAIGASHTFTKPSRFIASDATGFTCHYKDYRGDGTDRQQAMTLALHEFPGSCSTWWRAVSITSTIAACSPAPRRTRARTRARAKHARELLAVAPPSHADMPAEPADARPPWPCRGV
jgi:hypothetical protein